MGQGWQGERHLIFHPHGPRVFLVQRQALELTTRHKVRELQRPAIVGVAVVGNEPVRVEGGCKDPVTRR